MLMLKKNLKLFANFDLICRYQNFQKRKIHLVIH
jgi:hypothetical protein